MIQLHIANTAEEFNAVVHLITKMYMESGYINSEQNTENVISSYIGKSHTVTFLARHNDATTTGTISVVRDNPTGMPMDVLYRNELKTYRSQGYRIAEVCQFAVDASVLKNSNDESRENFSELDISMKLLGLVVHYGIKDNYDYLCFAVNPKHASFYESLGCIKIGEEKRYPSVNQAPALAYILDIQSLKNAYAGDMRRHFLIDKILQTPPTTGFFE